MLIGVPREIASGERRVAIVPEVVPSLIRAGHRVVVERGAGQRAGFTDEAYKAVGADVVDTPEQIYSTVQMILKVQRPGRAESSGEAELDMLVKGTVLIGLLQPSGDPALFQQLADRGIIACSMELVPRTTRAQMMDALSSQSTVAGYKAVLLAANALQKFFPMLMTAAGTVTPARVLVIGAGVAGLFAAATARRLGAVVSAYDVRPAAREQVESVGAKFVSLPLETGNSEDRGGYAREMDADFYRRQRELMAGAVKEHDVVITPAAVPGKRAPVLVTRDMVAGMAPGSVIVDVAAERGGNCELTRPGETVVEHQVTILGPL